MELIVGPDAQLVWWWSDRWPSLSVPKGEVLSKKIRVWNPMYGECGGALSGLSRGVFVVIALERAANVNPIVALRGE